MTDHPSTFNAAGSHRAGVDWNDRASLHRADDGGGILNAAKRLTSGTLAEMVAQVMAYPEHERGKYTIEKEGDHRLTLAEILILAARADYPHR